MIQIDAVRGWGISDFTVTEGNIASGSACCVWCDNAASVGKRVLVVREEGRKHTFIMHRQCLQREVKAARRMALDLSRLAQVQENRAPQRA